MAKRQRRNPLFARVLNRIDTGDIGHSLRFRASGSAGISLSYAAPTSQTTWTLFGYVKIGSGDIPLLHSYVSSSDRGSLYITSAGLIRCTATGVDWQTSAVQRDPTAWVPVLIARNGNSSYIVEVDGVTLSISYNAGSAAGANPINSAITHWINKLNTGGSDSYGDGYRARWCFVDGAVKTTSDFMTFNTQINKWVSKTQSQVKAVVDSGGANSRMYDFDDGTSLTTLGYDKSSKGNNATLNNFSLSGVTNDWMLDVPGNRYATLNPLTAVRANAIDGNLRVTAGDRYSITTMGVESGVWWATFKINAVGGNTCVGVATASDVGGSPPGNNAWSMGYLYTGSKYGPSGANVAYGASYTNGDTIGLRLDATNNTVEFFKQTGSSGAFVSQGVLSTGLSGTYYFAVEGRTSSGNNDVACNFGQQPLSDSSWLSGAKALCQANLPDIPAATLNPLNHAQVKLDTGANIKATCEAVFSGGNCLEIIKDRANSNNWQWVDIVRGLSAIIQSNTTNAETTYTAPSGSSVGIVLKANGAPVTNNAGSIQSQVSANVAAGFSIVTWTGTGVAGTIGHGLPVAPRMIIIKERAPGGDNWQVYHSSVVSLANGKQWLALNTTDSLQTNGSATTFTSVSSATFGVGDSGALNGSTQTYVAYCFADNRDLPGGVFRCFSDTANASTDGTYVDVGGKVLSVPFLKRVDSTSNWFDLDTVRDSGNPMSAQLYPNLANAESSATTMDACASGIKFRTTSAPNDGGTYIGLAILGCHGKYS